MDKDLAELKRKMDDMEKKEMHKAAVVSKLFAGTESAILRSIWRIIRYTWHYTPLSTRSRAEHSPPHFLGNAREWFRSLTPGSMDTFEDLAGAFLTHFLCSQECKKPSDYLLTLHQKEGENLKEFMIWFNTKKLKKIKDPDEGVVFSTIYNGISPDEPVVRKVARK